MLLIDKVAVVTGSAKRTGKAIALALARSGADVVIHYNKSRKEADKVVAEIKKLGRNSVAVKADLRNFSEVKAMFRKIVKKFKKIDILVNNAGIYPFMPFEKMTEDEADKILRKALTDKWDKVRIWNNVEYKIKDFVYINEGSGNIDEFEGSEIIEKNSETVFFFYYAGGFIG